MPIREIVAVDSVPELTRWFVEAACESNPRARDLLSEYEGPLAAHLAERQDPAREKAQK